MMLYNPFRPHIVEFSNSKFAVRRLTSLGWQYFTNQRPRPDNYWWNSLEFKHHFLVDSLDEARELLSMSKPLPKAQILKVYT